jgi:crossover junction endodeoxyribonuclease RuvC
MKLGIDPGITGALALIDDDGRCLRCVEMPVMVIRKKKRVNGSALARLIKSWTQGYILPVTAYLEDVHAMPGQGVSGMFNFGMSFGVVQGVLAALEIPVVMVSPGYWKKRAKLTGKEKQAARGLAQQLYPYIDLSLKKHIGRADALLISHFGGQDG